MKLQLEAPIPYGAVSVSLPGDVQGLGPGIRIEGEQRDVIGLLESLLHAASISTTPDPYASFEGLSETEKRYRDGDR